ncbi:MAG: DUF4296 domain-containing protein [Bacteroidota bacterium]
MKKYILLLLVVLSTTACKHKKETPPIAPALMQQMIRDIHLAEAYCMSIPDSTHSGKNKDSLARFYKEIFAHYKISEQDFDKGLEWYRLHPDDFDSVYGRVITDLGKIEATIPKK